jgi:ABC-type lipoprotein release transport system permease subunit
MKLADFVYVSVLIVGITFVVSIYPAITASKGVGKSSIK